MGKQHARTTAKSPGMASPTESATDFGDNSARQEEMTPLGSESETPALDSGGPGGTSADDPGSAGGTDGLGPSGLEARLTAGLAGSPTFAAMDAMIATADPKERQLAYRSDALHAAIAASALGPAEQLALATALAEGSLTWGSQASDARRSQFYEYFGVNNAEGPPPPMNSMNCYEVALYSAWRLGQITTEWIVKKFDDGEIGVPSVEDLGYVDTLPRYDAAEGAEPSIGDFVYLTHANAAGPWHVMLSLGGDVAISLWQRPARTTPTSRVNLSDYAKDADPHDDKKPDILQYGPPSWH